MRPAPRWNALKRAALWSLCGFCWAAASCLARPQTGGRALQPQQWAQARGPVVPHDSFPADCSLCHTGGSWHEIRSDFAFDHEKQTGVALRGVHAEAQCLRCHNDRGPVAIYANRGCAGCHEDVHRGRLGTECASCHGESTWSPIGLVASHNRTRFPLTGPHTAVACFRCHPRAESGEFVGTDARCEACHRDDLARAKEPDHMALGITGDCQRCHDGIVWGGAGFTHAGIVGGCATCHMKDYNAATHPNHVANAMPTTCESCHSTATWRGAQFTHAGITAGCASCHLPDYNATTNPNHATAGFPTSCEACHTTTTWRGAAFQHRFVITSGPHSRYQCAECHRTPSSYSNVSCTHCHAHSKTLMDEKHRERPGYAWSSPACIQCHPTGKD